MLKKTIKSSAVLFSFIALSSFAHAEALPKRSPDFKANFELAIKDRKADTATALCSATAYDLTKNKKYKYDRFGFTQEDYDAVLLSHADDAETKGDTNPTMVKISGEARKRNGSAKWDKVTVQCHILNNKINSISVTLKK